MYVAECMYWCYSVECVNHCVLKVDISKIMVLRDPRDYMHAYLTMFLFATDPGPDTFYAFVDSSEPETCITSLLDQPMTHKRRPIETRRAERSAV